MKPSALILCLTSLVVTASTAFGQFEPPTHVIRVRADSEIRAIPDKVVIILGVQSRDSLMNTAKLKNDNITKRAIGIAKKFGVLDNDISTEYYNVEPQYKTYEKQEFLGYRVTRRIIINLNDFSKFESLMNEFLAKGIENIQNIQFKVSDPDKYIAKALAAALKTAKAKAMVIATEMGLKIGKTYSVDESYSSIRSPNIGYGYAPGDRMYSPMLMAADASDVASTTFGYLNATANVTVSFEVQ